MNKSFITILFLSTATAGVFVTLTAKIFPLFAAKTVYFCQQFISNTLFQIPKSLPNSILFALGIMLALGLLSFFIQFSKTRSLLGRLLVKRVNFPKRVKKVVDSLLLTNKVYIVRDNNLFSFCFGVLSPRIIIATGLTNSLTSKELEAVLLHEQAHLKNYDPLKILLGQTVASMFFFLPIFSELYKNMVSTNEILADNWTIKTQNGSIFLRQAIRKIIATPQASLAIVPAIASDGLEIRISRLVSPSFKHKLSLSSISIITSILFALLSGLLLQTPVNAFNLQHQEEQSYFLCSANNACREQCYHNAQMSPLSSPENLFSSQVPKYQSKNSP